MMPARVEVSRRESDAPAQDLSHRDLQHRINSLRRVDNLTNWFYLVREYLYLSAVLGTTLVFYLQYADWGISWIWLVPVTLVAIVLIGIGQHRLVMLAHEASHYLLFHHPTLNEAASNWFCMYPIWSTTYNYRLQHLAHHQHTNDPALDPDLIYMGISGHRFYYPMPLGKFIWDCIIKLFLWIPGLVQNILLRAYLANSGGTSGPYKPHQRSARVLPLVYGGYLAVLIGFLAYGVWAGNGILLAAVPAALLAGLLLFTWMISDNLFMKTGVRPNIPPRWAAFQRTMYITLLLSAIAWLHHLTGHPWIIYYFILWLIPLGTVFSFLMLLREEIQHSNTPQEKYRDSRNFRGNALIRWAVFPYGQGQHLAHHLCPLVPHYNLAKLDELLRTTAAYRANVVDVEVYLLPWLFRRWAKKPSLNSHASSM